MVIALSQAAAPRKIPHRLLLLVFVYPLTACASRSPARQTLLEAHQDGQQILLHNGQEDGPLPMETLAAVGGSEGKAVQATEANGPESDWINKVPTDTSDTYRPVVPKVEVQAHPPTSAPKDHRNLRRSMRAGLARWLPPVTWNLLLNIGSGTGAAPGSTGDIVLDQDLMQRMRFQDKVVMILLLVAYAGSLAFSASLAYRQSVNTSPVTYYADPRYYTQVSETHQVEDFLDAFNTHPKDVQLQITGFSPLPPLHESFIDAAVDWLGSRYRIAFSFALDLSPWVVEEQMTPGRALASGMSSEDLQQLRDFLQNNNNDLASVQLEKVVHWPDWEELAVNVKHQIRQGGFTGILRVSCVEDEVMVIYKNKTWANFMHRRATKVLCALSIVGWILYQPYMWFRQRALVIKTHYRVDVAISNYWPLIADKMGPEGFNSN